MITVKELKVWLNQNCNDDEDVAIDEGGLTLVLIGTDQYLEIGGDPDGEGGDDDI